MEPYFYPAKLVMRNYKPLHLEKGMLFLAKLYEGTEREYSEVWELQSNTYSLEDFIKLHGYPVRPIITDEYEYDIFAEEDKIGWIMNEEEEMLTDISIEDINYILLLQNGNIDILIEDTTDEDIVPILEEGKVIIRIPIEEDYKD